MNVRVPSWRLGVTDGQEFVRHIETSKEFYNCARNKVVQDNGYIEFSLKKNSAVIYICKK